MQRSQRTLIAATLVVVLASGCGSRGGGQQGRGGPPPLAVDVQTAQRKDIATYISLDGQIAPLQEATLSSAQSGTLAAVYVNEGQRVGRGQLLAKIDDSTLRANLAAQQAAAQQVQARLGSSQLAATVAPANSQSQVATAQQQVINAQNAVTSASAALDNARLTYNSNTSLLRQGYVSQTAYEQSRAQYVAAQQTLANAREALRQAQVASRSAGGQAGIAVPQAQQQVAQDRASLQAAQAQIQLIQTQISQTNVTAPFDGVVTQRLLDPGAFAGPNQPIVRVSQLDSVYVNVNVPDEDLAYIRKGTPVSFVTSSLPGKTFHGAVFDVNAVPTSGTLSYRARVQMANPGAVLRGGMLATATVQKEKHVGAIVVPRSAVFQTDTGANVFTVADSPKCAPPPGAGGAPGGGAGAKAGGPGAGGPGGPGGGAPPVMKQAAVENVRIGLQTDTETEVRGGGIAPGTPVITTRPDALQDKSCVMYSAPRVAVR